MLKSTLIQLREDFTKLSKEMKRDLDYVIYALNTGQNHWQVNERDIVDNAEKLKKLSKDIGRYFE